MRTPGAAEFSRECSTSPHTAAVRFTVFMLLPLICSARGGKEETENRDVGKHEGGKELQGKCKSCTTEHGRGHFLQLTETKDRQKAPSQQWYASITF
ncbi:hypothetical protein cypCar_00048795 [Cyprinus carpio]|nr:hypothetical protein cypCar_00048795 [Cyprinus carpio]